MQRARTDPFSRFRSIADELNERHRTYLETAYREDQLGEAIRRTPEGLEANIWRWIEHGPVARNILAMVYSGASSRKPGSSTEEPPL
jgi:hypothetical protein